MVPDLQGAGAHLQCPEAQEPRLKGAIFFKVDCDKEKNFLRAHSIPRQSTVLVFRGKQETVRSIAEGQPKQLREAVIAGI